MNTQFYNSGNSYNSICGVYRHDTYFNKGNSYDKYVVVFNLGILQATEFIGRDLWGIHKNAVVDNYGNLIAVSDHY